LSIWLLLAAVVEVREALLRLVEAVVAQVVIGLVHLP
jgi:hypothetical protein